MDKKTLKKAVRLYCNLAGINYKLRFGKVCLSDKNYFKIRDVLITNRLIDIFEDSFDDYLTTFKK